MIALTMGREGIKCVTVVDGLFNKLQSGLGVEFIAGGSICQFHYFLFVMDSAKSFFPTRAEIHTRNAHRSKLYRICKEMPNNITTYRTLEPQSTSNIFKEGEMMELSKEMGRPIGGEDLFKRMDLAAQQRKGEGRLRRTSKDYYQRNVYTSISNNNQRIKKNSTEMEDYCFGLQANRKETVKTEVAEELYRSHQAYKTIKPEQQASTVDKLKRGAKSLQTIQPKLLSMRTIEKVDKQVQEHHDKMALLGEIDRKRPLVELCGDAYFQMILRNRFEDDLKLPNYIYRIKDKFTENKVISKLRSYRPNIQQRRNMILRGRTKTQLERPL